MKVRVVKNWGLSVDIKNLMTGETRTEKWERVDPIEGITPLYQSPDGSLYTIGKVGLTNVDKYINGYKQISVAHDVEISNSDRPFKTK